MKANILFANVVFSINSTSLDHIRTDCHIIYSKESFTQQFRSYNGPRTTWANEMKFGMNHSQGAGCMGC